MTRAWVVVLGDVGRSPRMQYHTSSLCKTVRRKKPDAAFFFNSLPLTTSSPIEYGIFLTEISHVYLHRMDILWI